MTMKLDLKDKKLLYELDIDSRLSASKLAKKIGISKQGIEFDSIDGNPVHLIVLVAAGERQHKDYLKLLSHIMAVLKDEAVREKIINSSSNKEIIEAVKA